MKLSDVLFLTVRALEPVLIHFLASNLISMIGASMGLHADAASLTTITAVLVLPLFLSMMKRDERNGNRRDHEKMPLWMYGAIPVAAVVCNLIATAGLNGILQLGESLFGIRISNEVQEGLFLGWLPMQILGLGILVPIMEEVLFRGLVYNRFRDYNKEWLSVFLGAAVFAVYHGNLIQILFAFPMGLIITEVYRRGKTIQAPVLFHMAVNLSSVLLSYVGGISG